MPEDEISEQGRNARFEQWEKLGLDRVKHDLLNGGHRLVGGPPRVRELAWEWVRMKEAATAKPQAAQEDTKIQAKRDEILTLKPSFYGISLNLNELWRRFRDWLKAK